MLQAFGGYTSRCFMMFNEVMLDSSQGCVVPFEFFASESGKKS